MNSPSLTSFQPVKLAARPTATPLDIIAGVVVVATLLALSGLFLNRAPLRDSLTVFLGATAPPVTQRFQVAETNDEGQGFRWTNGDSEVIVPAQGLGRHRLEVTLSAPRPEPATVPATVSVNGWPALQLNLTGRPRRYMTLVPGARVQLGDNSIRIQSPTFAPQENNLEPRQLGVALFHTSWQGLEVQPWLVAAQMLVIAFATGFFYLALMAGGIRFWARLLALVLFLAITLAMRHSDTRFIYRWQALIWTAGCGALFLVVWLALRYWRAGDPRLPVRRWLAQHWPAFAGYGALTAALLYPLFVRFATHIIGFPGDAHEYLWKMQWFSDALIQRQVSPAFAPQIYGPNGYEVALSEMTPAHTLLGLPFTWLFGSTISYNVMTAASFLLTACFTYLLALRLGASKGAAWVAGIAFAFCLRRYFHAVGHLPMMGTQWVVLALYGWEGALTRRRNWDGYLVGLGLALAAWSSWYLGVTLALLLACYTLFRTGLRSLPGLLASGRPTLVAGLVCVALLVPFIQPYLEARAAGGIYRHGYGQLRLHSILPYEYLLPNPLHPIWGGWAQQFFRPNDGSERLVALGYTVVGLALIGVWLRWKQPIARALVVIALINMMMTFGPEWRLPDGTVIPLPVRFVYDYVPILDSIRVWSRMALYVSLCAALLASLALTALPRRWYHAGWCAAAALVTLESAVAFPMHQPGPRPVDRWLKQRPHSALTIEMPRPWGGTVLYYTLFSEQPTNGGYGTFDPPFYQEGRPVLESFPRESALRLLQRWQTDYIIIQENAMSQVMPDWQARLAAQPLVTVVYRNNGYSVYRIRR